MTTKIQEMCDNCNEMEARWKPGIDKRTRSNNPIS